MKLNGTVAQITDEPAPPHVKFASLVFYRATELHSKEMHLARHEGDFVISLDGEMLSPPKAELYPHVVNAILGFAGLRLWPWSRKFSGKRLDIEFKSSGLTSSWELETQNIKKELTLKRICEHRPPADR